MKQINLILIVIVLNTILFRTFYKKTNKTLIVFFTQILLTKVYYIAKVVILAMRVETESEENIKAYEEMIKTF